MSNFADPNKSYAWLDGDAFRGASGMAMPADPFAEQIPEMMPYGGIEAGFEQTAEQQVTKKKVFNYRKAAYKVLRDSLDQGMKFRAVDNSQATLLTRAQGGTIKIVSGKPLLTLGKGEEFSLLVRLDDGDDEMAFFCPHCTLSAPATRAAIDGQTIDGWEFTVTFLAEPVEVLPALPEGMTGVEGQA